MVGCAANPAKSSTSGVVSPCVRNCCLDDQDICLGCLRSLDEIKAWRQVGQEGQMQILNAVAMRRALRRTPQNPK